jgi:hypothetical protein
MTMTARLAMLAAILAASLLAPGPAARAQSPDTGKPMIGQFADTFAAACETMIVSRMGDSAREQLGTEVPPALIDEMESVGRAGVCGCFVQRMRDSSGTPLAAPFEAGDIDAYLEGLRPDFDRCMGDALKPKIATLCTLTADTIGKPAGDTCACVGREVQALDSAEFARSADHMFRAFNDSARATEDGNALERIVARCSAAQQ